MENLFKKKFMRVPHLSMGGAFKEIGRNAFTDWILVLIVSVGVGGALIAGGAYLYLQVTSGNFKPAESSTTVKKIFDKSELTSIIDRFKVHEEASLQIKKGYRGPTDPSL